MATVKDIAKLAGVSPATVSLALNGKSVSRKALTKVLRAAEELEYQPKLSARSLRSGKMMSVGFYVVEESFEEACNSGYLFPLIAGISSTLSTNGYSLQFQSFMPDTIDVITKKALEQSVDAMIILPHYRNVASTLMSALDKTKLPVVFLQCETTLDAHTVVIDNSEGARIALKYLYANGHVDIGMVAGPEYHVDSLARLDAYTSMAKELNLVIRKDWIQYGNFTIESGFECANRILGSNDRPTALFCLNDYMAVGAMHAIRQRGLRVPGDISVVGFDDSPVSQACSPRLTTIKQPFIEQGTIGANIVLEILSGQTTAVQTHIVQPKLVERESVAPLNQR